MLRQAALPDESLLAEYRRNGDYTDCYSIDIQRPVSLARVAQANSEAFAAWHVEARKDSELLRSSNR